MKRFLKDTRTILGRRDWPLLVEYFAKRGLVGVFLVLLLPWWLVAAVCVFSEMMWKYVIQPPLNLAMWPLGRTLDLHKRWYRELAAKYKDRHMSEDAA